MEQKLLRRQRVAATDDATTTTRRTRSARPVALATTQSPTAAIDLSTDIPTTTTTRRHRGSASHASSASSIIDTVSSASTGTALDEGHATAAPSTMSKTEMYGIIAGASALAALVLAAFIWWSCRRRKGALSPDLVATDTQKKDKSGKEGRLQLSGDEPTDPDMSGSTLTDEKDYAAYSTSKPSAPFRSNSKRFQQDSKAAVVTPFDLSTPTTPNSAVPLLTYTASSPPESAFRAQPPTRPIRTPDTLDQLPFQPSTPLSPYPPDLAPPVPVNSPAYAIGNQSAPEYVQDDQDSDEARRRKKDTILVRDLNLISIMFKADLVVR